MPSPLQPSIARSFTIGLQSPGFELSPSRIAPPPMSTFQRFAL
jgi:hypothetical protein